MQRHEIIGADLPYGRQGFSQILRRVGRKVEAADDRVHFLDAGDLLRLSHRIDHPAVTAGRENNQPPVPEIEGGCDLMVELVEERSELLLGVAKAGRRATRSVIHAELHHARRFQLFEALLGDAARGKAMAADKGRLRRRHHHQISGLESLPVDHAEIALDRRSHPIARAEGVFAADVEWQLRLQLAGIVPEEAGETAKMVIMPMAAQARRGWPAEPR